MINSAYVSTVSKTPVTSDVWRIPHHEAVIFEVECHRTSFTLVILKLDTKETILSFEIEKPSFVVVNETNWATYVDHCLDTYGVMDTGSRSKTWVTKSGVTLIKRRSIGLIVFQVNTVDGKSHRITTLEKTENFTGCKVNVPYKVFDSKFPDIIDYVYISMDLNGLTIRPVSVNKSILGKSYSLPFTEPMSIDDIYYTSTWKEAITPNLINNMTHDHIVKSCADEYQMMRNRVGRFRYLESSDGLFKMVIHPRFTEPIVKLIREALIIAVQKEETKGLYDVLDHTNSNDSLDSVFKFMKTIKDN